MKTTDIIELGIALATVLIGVLAYSLIIAAQAAPV